MTISPDFPLIREYQTISDYLMAFATDKETFAVFYRKDYEDCEMASDGEFLTVSTIHSAKGLEWDHVFVMGLCEGNFPNSYFCKDRPVEEQQVFFNNEWKKMYVAATRAKQSLVLTYSSTIKWKGYSFNKSLNNRRKKQHPNYTCISKLFLSLYLSSGTLHIDESVFAFILEEKSGQFHCIEDKPAFITLYGYLCPLWHIPYRCGVSFIWCRAVQSLSSDTRIAPHFFHYYNLPFGAWQKND